MLAETEMDRLAEQIKLHEGLRLTPYLDSVQIWTVGYGHNLEKPISYRAAQVIFEDDLNDAINDCAHAFPWFFDLTVNRRYVLVDMCFNLGLTRLKTFSRMFRAIEKEDWEWAAAEMLRSLWAEQVKDRAKRLAAMMREG